MSIKALASAVGLILVSTQATAQVAPQEDPFEAFESGANLKSPNDSVIIPIVGAMESTGIIAGTVASKTGVGQADTQLVGFGAYSVNDSYIAFLGYYNFALSERWRMDISGLQAEFMDSTFYVDPVSGDASPADSGQPVDASYIQQDWFITFRYLLSEDHAAQSRLALHGGLPVDPEPIASTTFEVEPFYRAREVRARQGDNVHGKTLGISATLDRDTRDFWPSPSQGHHAYLKVDRDWGSDQRASYTRWEAQYSHYLDLGLSRWARQQTLALTAYLSDIPTWRKDDPSRQPDWFAQSVLGGSERLRGYGDERFNDRSALYYGAEYRAIPNWQPQNRLPFFNRYDFPWWQIAVFAELGNVEDRLALDDLHDGMKWSAGFGFRFFIERMVARADFGFSNEESLFHFTVNQPF
ncbi:BamA/TamA family outer membrane protein [Ferrimonas balearica]|uniref:BamA/TamA family outer membrane protein n=1 Tax=Ferrimonas balearica TaxID=44012 RepID=UPI001C971B28|nr:BamA/TamA family outer membrane protein [Ferrimonas balearica]MBY5979650.1 BamA/TamA family outer membrane protein [Ferrimonas balearica]